ncbi:hypothetical protein [Nocardia sp. NPDC057030]|uniref:hypothetical protein n=1 Tax=unclassified Nocardia TaxID=2637762 RepID=UPI003630B3C9
MTAVTPWNRCTADRIKPNERTKSETKVVATYSKARLQCGTDNWGYRHIQQRHQTEWEALGAIENRNWRDIADLAIAKSLDAPDQSGPAGGSKTCYSGQIYLVNHVTGQIAKTIQPTIIVGGDGTILTAYPGGGCR